MSFVCHQQQNDKPTEMLDSAVKFVASNFAR